MLRSTTSGVLKSSHRARQSKWRLLSPKGRGTPPMCRGRSPLAAKDCRSGRNLRLRSLRSRYRRAANSRRWWLPGRVEGSWRHRYRANPAKQNSGQIYRHIGLRGELRRLPKRKRATCRCRRGRRRGEWLLPEWWSGRLWRPIARVSPWAKGLRAAIHSHPLEEPLAPNSPSGSVLRLHPIGE